MKVRVLLFICSCLAWNACAQPSPCDFSVSDFYDGECLYGEHTEINAITTSGTFDYDALGQQIRIRSSGSSPSGTFSLDLLMQFQQKVVYEIDYLERTCKKVPLDAPFNPIQIPPGSFPVAQTVLGTSSVAGMGLLANTWYGEIPEIQATYTWVFSDNACVPLSGTYYFPESGTIIISFYNI